MTIEEAIHVAARRNLRIRFDVEEINEAGGVGISYSEVDGDPVRAVIALVEAVEAGE